jgi:F0F1-type ATP synthase epsilon subunit
MKALLVMLMLALGGCATLQPVAVDGIVGEAVQLARASSADQKAALSRAQELFAAEASTLNRLRLATLLATLPAPLRDDARAMDLLDPIVDANASGAGRFAAFLALQVSERQRLGREAERLGRERAGLERERQSADKERDKREEALRQQLEALRSIERGILEREERLHRKPGARQ